MTNFTEPTDFNDKGKLLQTYSFLIEPGHSNGVKTVSLNLWNKEDLAKKSEEAMVKAMNAIQNIAQRVDSTIGKISEGHKPDDIEIAFGIKFDADLDIIVAKVGAEASIAVTLNWKLK